MPEEEKTEKSKKDVSDAEILEYVRKYRKEEFTFDEIRSSLLDQGCEKQRIERAIVKVKAETEGKNTDPSQYNGIVLLVALFVLSQIAFYFFLARTGLKGEFLFSLFSSMFGLLEGSIVLHVKSLLFALLFFILATAAFVALQYKKTSMKVLHALPVLYPLSSFLFFGFSRFALVASISIALSHYYLIITAEKRKDSYKKLLVYDLSGELLMKCFFPAFLIIASFVAIATFEDGSYAQTEVSRIFSSAGFDTGNVDSLHTQLEERQLENTYKVLETVENSLLVSSKRRMSTTCAAELEDSLEDIDKDAKAQLQQRVQEGGFIEEEQVKKLESITRMVGNMRRFYPLLAGVFSLMFFEMIKKLLVPLIASVVWLLMRMTS